MHGDVISLVALDLELRVIFSGMVRIAFVLCIACVDLDYPAGNIASLGIPENVIADFKVFAHSSTSIPRLALSLTHVPRLLS